MVPRCNRSHQPPAEAAGYPSGFVDFGGGAVQDQGVEVDAARFVAGAGEVPGGGAVQDGEGAPEQVLVA